VERQVVFLHVLFWQAICFWRKEMSEEKAFPRADGRFDSSQKNEQGMTLRDYFAAKAMQALLSDSDWRQDMDFKDTAIAAYRQADVMMKEREA
jgi:hypothetical protein